MAIASFFEFRMFQEMKHSMSYKRIYIRTMLVLQTVQLIG